MGVLIPWLFPNVSICISGVADQTLCALSDDSWSSGHVPACMCVCACACACMCVRQRNWQRERQVQ